MQGMQKAGDTRSPPRVTLHLLLYLRWRSNGHKCSNLFETQLLSHEGEVAHSLFASTIVWSLKWVLPELLDAGKLKLFYNTH